MAPSISSANSGRARIAAAILWLSALLVGSGGFGFGRAGIWGPPIVLAGILGVVACSRVIWPQRLAASIASVLVAIALGLVSNLTGRAWLNADVRTDFERLRPRIVSPERVPDIFDVPGSAVFQRAFVSADPNGYGHRVRLPLRDGSVVEYVSDERSRSHERLAPCSEELGSGLFRKFRCQN